MNDALRKAAEERDRKRRQRGQKRAADPVVTPTADAPEVPRTEAVTVDEPPVSETPVRPTRRSDPEAGAPAAVEETPPPATATPVVEEPRRTPSFRETPAAREAPAGEAPVPDPEPTSRAARARVKAREQEARRRREYEQPDEATGAARVDRRVISFHEPRDVRTEQIRGVRTSLLAQDPVPKSIVMTSGSPGEGKSLAAANLAACLVEGGHRTVLLVDANLRHPELSDLVGGRTGPGLSDLMNGSGREPGGLIQETGIPGVALLNAGEALANPGSLLNPKALSGVLGLVEDRYDFVIVDTPSLDEYADAAVMAPEVDGAIIVVQVEGPPRSNSEKALEMLEAARARVLGIIATNCRE